MTEKSIDDILGSAEETGTGTATAEAPKKGRKKGTKKAGKKAETESGDLPGTIPNGNVAYLEVPLEAIEENAVAAAIRQDRDEEAQAALQASIKTMGIINPLIVRKDGDRLLLLGGYRRLEAARALKLKTVPVHVVSDQLGTTVMELFGRTRFSGDHFDRVLGLVDNTARSALSERDLLLSLRWLVDQNKDRYLKEDKRIAYAVIAKDIGMGAQAVRNRALILESYDEDEIHDIAVAVEEEERIAWSQVHAMLRSSKEGVEAVNAIVWPEEETEGEEGEESEGREKAKKAREKIARERAIKARVNFDMLSDEGWGVSFLKDGAKTFARFEFDLPITGIKTLFSGAKASDNLRDLFQGAADAALEWATWGTADMTKDGKPAGKKAIDEAAPEREGLIGAMEAAVASLLAKASKEK